MAGPKGASNKAGSGNGSSTIPPSDRKLVANLKEVVPHSDEEIYAMLKECNRDPDETVQRLLSQETFHVVKSKRDKKKEPSRDTPDNRTSSGSSVYPRSGRGSGSFGASGMGRGSSLPRTYAAEANGVRSKMSVGRGNGTLPAHKVPGSESTGVVSYSQLVQPKSSISNDHFQPGEQPTAHSSLLGSWPATSVPAAPTLQGAWLGSGRGTVADLLKSKTSSIVANKAISSTTISTMQTDQQPKLSMQLAPSDPVLNPVLNPSAVVKREVGAVGNQRHVTYAVPDIPSCVLNTTPSTIERNLDSLASQISNPSASLLVEDQNKNSNAFVDTRSHVLGGSAEVLEVYNKLVGNPISNASIYTSEQAAGQSEYTDDNSQSRADEGKTVEAVSTCTNGDESLSSTELSATTGRLQELSMRENQPVIIPDHIRISESECTMLNFGSFGSSFEDLPSSIAVEGSVHFESCEGSTEDQSSQAVAAETISSVADTTSTADLNQEQPSFSATGRNDGPVVDVAAQNEEDVKKEDSAEQNLHQYPTSYSSMHHVTSDDTNNFTSEAVETRPQDIDAVLQPYDNSTYYSGMFRSAPEVDSRYSAFLPAGPAKLVTPNRAVAAASAPASSQEASSATSFAGSASVGGQAMQVINNSSSTMALPQQSLPIYATQPSGLPLGPFTNVFSYPYMPPGFSYLQSPYQHNYMGNMGTGNYHQVPTAVGGAGMKYPVPQYKTGGAVGGMHTSYGAYANSQPGSFPVNPPATSGSTSNFDDNASQQFKEANVYMPNQQMDGHSVWLQTQLGRDVQGSSYYNLSVPNQNQQARYSQTQSLLAHAHPGAIYGNLYQQQSGSSSGAHQMLQQQPNVGSVGSLGTQIGSYQQAQRSQQTWTNGF